MIPQDIARRCKTKQLKEDRPNEPRIVEILPYDPACEDCGKICVLGRTVEHTLMPIPQTHWRSQCKVCGNYRDLSTGRYDIEHSHKYLAISRQHFKDLDK